jgi:hypothetical protein
MSKEQQLPKTTGWASPFLEPAQTIRPLPRGPSSELGYPLGTGSGRIAAVTERHLCLFESSMWGRMSRARGIVAKPPPGRCG